MIAAGAIITTNFAIAPHSGLMKNMLTMSVIIANAPHSGAMSRSSRISLPLSIVVEQPLKEAVLVNHPDDAVLVEDD